MSKTQYLSRRRDELMLTLMYKLYHRSAAADADPRPRAAHGTRSENKKLFQLRRPVTESYKRSPVYRGNMLWNVQPEWLKDNHTKAQLKRNLKRVDNLREKYP